MRTACLVTVAVLLLVIAAAVALELDAARTTEEAAALPILVRQKAYPGRGEIVMPTTAPSLSPDRGREPGGR